MELFPVLQDLKRHHFLVLVVITADDDAKGTLAELLLNFISVINLLFSFVEVVGLVVIESMVVNA